MKLYSFDSINPVKVVFGLNELGLADITQVEMVDLFAGQQKSPAFTRLNAMQKVPVFEDEELALAESNAILVYLAERERKLWPASSLERARAFRWLFLEAAHLSDNVGQQWFNETVAPKHGIPVDQVAVDRTRANIQKPLQALESQLGETRWIMEEFSIVDCSIGTDLIALATTSISLDNFPNLLDYIDRIEMRPAWPKGNVYFKRFARGG